MARLVKEKTAQIQAAHDCRLSTLDIARLLQQAMSPILEPEEDEALDQAKELVFKALEERGAKLRVALAKQAIEISPLCADALLILADNAVSGSDEQLRLHRDALHAGRKALSNAFDDLSGEFWGVIETRPYMRARLALAICLWKRNERAEALDHLRDMLRLNPNDNQGVRSILASYPTSAMKKAVTRKRPIF